MNHSESLLTDRNYKPLKSCSLPFPVLILAQGFLFFVRGFSILTHKKTCIILNWFMGLYDYWFHYYSYTIIDMNLCFLFLPWIIINSWGILPTNRHESLTDRVFFVFLPFHPLSPHHAFAFENSRLRHFVGSTPVTWYRRAWAQRTTMWCEWFASMKVITLVSGCNEGIITIGGWPLVVRLTISSDVSCYVVINHWWMTTTWLIVVK